MRNAISIGRKACAPLLLLVAALLAGCSPNQPFRTAGHEACSPENSDCASVLIEKHPAFDLGFVEFTERGNVFDRDNMNTVLNHVADLAAADSPDARNGLVAVVYVHGWKHNAAASDSNVQNFRQMLDETARVIAARNPDNPRRLVGIYVGWRGKSVNIPVVKNLSYWERKRVAHQVGKGGVTELLLRLENLVVDESDPNRNLFLITAHSFGSVITLSALNEILLERIVDARPAPASEGTDGTCRVSRPFGHGVVLINPAIEANELLQLKEAVAAQSFCPSQDRLMHVISSDADTANGIAFPLGQTLGVNLRWRQTALTREIHGETLTFAESNLDTTTIGNYAPFRTGRMDKPDDAPPDALWDYYSCVEGRDHNEARTDCLTAEEIGLRNHIRAKSHEPLAFILTDGTFIGDHNAVFTDSVAAYLSAIVAEARYKRRLAGAAPFGDELPVGCGVGANAGDGAFDFGTCFDNYQRDFKAVTGG